MKRGITRKKQEEEAETRIDCSFEIKRENRAKGHRICAE